MLTSVATIKASDKLEHQPIGLASTLRIHQTVGWCSSVSLAFIVVLIV